MKKKEKRKKKRKSSKQTKAIKTKLCHQLHVGQLLLNMRSCPALVDIPAVSLLKAAIFPLPEGINDMPVVNLYPTG